MATKKWAANAVMNAALNVVKGSGTHIYVVTASCSDPPTYNEVASTQALTGATALLTGSITSGDVSGRKVPINAHNSISVTASGTAAGVAIVRSSTSAVLYTTLLSTPVAVTSGGTINVAAWDITIADPTV